MLGNGLRATRASRRARFAAGLMVALAVGALLSVLVSGALAATTKTATGGPVHAGPPPTGTTTSSTPTTSTTSTTLAPGLATTATPTKCGATDKKLATSSKATSQAAGDLMVPTGAASVLLCDYNGMKNPPPTNDPLRGPYGLIGRTNVATASTVSKLVSELNAVQPTSGSYSCPLDHNADIVAHFRYSHGRSYRYVIDTGACNAIRSGSVGRQGLDDAFIKSVTQAVRPKPYGTVTGKVIKRKGADPGVCDPQCGTSVTAELVSQAGKLVASTRVGKQNRFTLYAAPGRYRLFATTTSTGKGAQPLTKSHVRYPGASWVRVKNRKTTRANARLIVRDIRPVQTAPVHTREADGRVSGQVQTCGGPAGSDKCRDGRARFCDQNNRCVTDTRVEFKNSGGEVVKRVKIKHHRFTARLLPGSYQVILLWTSKSAAPKAGTGTEVTQVTVTAGKTAHTALRVQIS